MIMNVRMTWHDTCHLPGHDDTWNDVMDYLGVLVIYIYIYID